MVGKKNFMHIVMYSRTLMTPAGIQQRLERLQTTDEACGSHSEQSRPTGKYGLPKRSICQEFVNLGFLYPSQDPLGDSSKSVHQHLQLEYSRIRITHDLGSGSELRGDWGSGNVVSNIMLLSRHQLKKQLIRK